MRRILNLVAAGFLAVTALVMASAAPVAAQIPVSVGGDGACQSDGSYKITWTVTNTSGDGLWEYSVESASLDGVTTQVEFPPTLIGQGQSVTATTVVAGTVAGTLSMSAQVHMYYDGGDEGTITVHASVDAPGNCPQPVATTTVTPTTAQRAATVTVPTFTG